jgi:hypothetical protein
MQVEQAEGFSSCPILLLEALINFVSQVTTLPIYFGEEMPQKEMGIAILQELLLNQEENRELVHEIIRQSMMHNTMRTGTYILNTWIMTAEGEQFEFLVASGPNAMSSAESLIEEDSSTSIRKMVNPASNKILRRYLNYLRLAALDKRMDDETLVLSPNCSFNHSLQ